MRAIRAGGGQTPRVHGRTFLGSLAAFTGPISGRRSPCRTPRVLIPVNHALRAPPARTADPTLFPADALQLVRPRPSHPLPACPWTLLTPSPRPLQASLALANDHEPVMVSPSLSEEPFTCLAAELEQQAAELELEAAW